jgi:hypothetical protein
MDSIKNKEYLWNYLMEQKQFKEEVALNKTVQLFESMIEDYNSRDLSLEEKNRQFIDAWLKRLEDLALVERGQWLEERLNKRAKQPPPPSDLIEIKRLLYEILERLE